MIQNFQVYVRITASLINCTLPNKNEIASSKRGVYWAFHSFDPLQKIVRKIEIESRIIALIYIDDFLKIKNTRLVL